MNEGIWESAIKNLQIAMRIHRMQPEFNLAMGQCYMEQGKIEEAVQYFGNVVRTKPKSQAGWKALIRCLIEAGFMEEAREQCVTAMNVTVNKPIFIFYFSAILFYLGKSKEGLLQLEKAMEKAPKLLKKFIEINPSILQNSQVVDVVARYKKGRKL